MLKLVGLVLYLGVVFTTPAMACSLWGGYRVPSNIELVQDADLIVLAGVASGPSPRPRGGGGESNSQIVLGQPQVLKGSEPTEPLRLFGQTYERGGEPVKPQPVQLSKAHPSSYRGACVRTHYAEGTLVVAMFKRTPQGIQQLSYPFARQVEDVSGPDAVWVRAVRLYVKVLDGPIAGQKAEFARLQKQLAESREPDDHEIAEDISGYLALASRPAPVSGGLSR